MWPFKKKKTALVLGGGSARGFAHIGVLKVFEEEGFKFDMVVGTSIGALIGAGYCLGARIDTIYKEAVKMRAADILDITISRMGLTEGNKLENKIRGIVGDARFEDLKVPLAVTATDIETGENIYFTSGELLMVIKASCSIPGIFKPVDLGGRMLIDGGMRQSVPVDIALKLGANFIVAVDVGFCIRKGRITSMLGVIMQSIQIMGGELNKRQARLADIVISPELGGEIDQLAFDKAEIIIKSGEEAARKAVPALRKRLGNG
ncbi:MAG: patatin-like phospholipase family protein [Candidatus Omnitrophota bacterium]